MITFEKLQQVKAMIRQVYFKNHYNLITIDLSQQQKLDAGAKEIQQIIFTGNLNRAEFTTIFFIVKEDTVLDFSKGTVKVS